MGESSSYTMGGGEETYENPSVTQEERQDSGEQLLAGKYKSQEELDKGILELVKSKTDPEAFYKSLESGEVGLPHGSNEETQQEQETQQETQEEQQQETQEETQEEQQQEKTQVEQILEENNLNIEQFNEELVTNGELSEDSYNKLTQVFPKEMVDNYLAGVQHQVEQYQNTLFEVAGSQEDYEAMIQWGQENLSDQEIKQFNDAVNSGDPARAKMAVRSVAHAYQQANGGPTNPGNNLIEGNRRPQANVQGYQSRAEMVRDMQDSRYETDVAFRQQVEEKLKRTTAF